MDQLAKDVLSRYALPGPRYTSYPTASAFVDSFGAREYHQELRIASLADEPLSLYVQLPACRHRGAACACDRLARTELAETHLQGLQVELALLAEALDERRRISRLHLDGGMANFVSQDYLEKLWSSVRGHFVVDPGSELGVELIPRVTSDEQLKLLRGFGFSRLSLEVETLDLWPQRRLAAALLCERLELCRGLGYVSVHVDLLYALPGQSPSAFADSLEEVLELRPDRLALHNLAHLSRKFIRQRGMDSAAMPAARERVELQSLAATLFAERGYRPIGYDHFALGEDALCTGLDRKTLHRGLMGYSAAPQGDLIGVGMAAVGEVQGVYVQNLSNFAHYLAALSKGHLPVARGYRKSAEDELRGEIIQSLLCFMEADLVRISRAHGRSVDAFRPELSALRKLELDGLVQVSEGVVRVTEMGRLAVRAVAMVFDRHLDRSSMAAGVSAQA